MEGITPLCILAQKYGTGKCPKIDHGYTPYYYKLIKDKRQTIKKVLEIGIGLKNGASLRMWREFFPNAQIFGADNNPKTFVNEKRITSFFCDYTNQADLKNLIRHVGGDVDLFIDDADHVQKHQVFLAKTVLPLLKDDVIYIIEDVFEPEYILSKLQEFNCELVEFSKKRADRIIVIRKISSIKKTMKKKSKIISPTPLCLLAEKYGTDKCPKYKHGFTPIYYELLKDKRKTIKKVVEVGIGNFQDIDVIDISYNEQTGALYHKGASLKMWRDFFPNAQVVGADIVAGAMFEDERIKTFNYDSTKHTDIKNLISTVGSDIDLFVDDGSHVPDDRIFLAKTVLPLLKDNVLYFIEGVTHSDYVIKKLTDYDCKVFNGGQKWRDDNLILVSKKKSPKKESKIKSFSFYAKPAFFRSKLYRGSSMIRAEQISKYLSANYNPKERIGTCIWVKPENLKSVTDGDYVDFVDGNHLIPLLKKRPNVKVIACSLSAYMYLKKNLTNKIVLIPQHHCNYENYKRKNRAIKIAGTVGVRSGFPLDIFYLQKRLHRIGVDFKPLFKYRNRVEIVEYYKNIDIQIVWAVGDRPYKNPIKIINAASFGIPTFAPRKKAYKEVEGFYIPVKSVDDLIEKVKMYKNKKTYESFSRKIIKMAQNYHIETIAKMYRKL